jgi:formylglycine-generating enzyme required for sulfatase activity/serine/threonine protein kinase
MAAAIDRPALRKLLEKVLLSVADFDAFCLDYFPEVYSRLEGPGDLKTKQNLLLYVIDPIELHTALGKAHPEKIQRYEKREETLLERGSRELSERLERLLRDRSIVAEWTADTNKIDAEIESAKKALRKGLFLQVGEVLSDKYQLVESLGNGTFAEVWHAKILGGADGEMVALKVLHGRWCKDPSFIQRFVTGAKILEQLSHPNIVRLLVPATESQGFYYLAMEYLAGGDLHRAVLKDKTGQHRERWIRAVLDVGKALDYAHKRIPQLVHRDVKPHNILLDEHGRGKLGDFDLVLDPSAARGTQTYQGLGTPDFSAPEQARHAGRVDQRADVYGLAKTMLFVLHGQSWSEGLDPDRPLLELVETTPAVKEVLRRATAYHPTDRTNTVARFCEELEDALKVRAPAAVAVAAAPVPIAQHEPVPTQEVVTTPTAQTVPPVAPSPTPPVATTEPKIVADAKAESSGIAETALVVPKTSKPELMVSRLQSGRNRWLGVVVAIAVAGTSGILLWRMRSPGAGSSGSVTVATTDLAIPVDLAIRNDLAEAPDLPAANQTMEPVAISNQAQKVEPPKQTEPSSPPPPAKIPGMIWIPEGTFMMGSNTGESDEKPAHSVTLPGFYLDRTEVTMAQYRSCETKGGCTELAKTVKYEGYSETDVKKWSPFCNVNQQDDRSKHPVNCVDWRQAAAYCKWVGKRLPTEEEWEYAARGPDGRKYPWGNEAPRAGLLNACGSECVEMAKKKGMTWSSMYSGNDGWETTAPVGSVKGDKSPFGIMDMGGNVAEWVQDWYRDAYRKPNAPTGSRSLRGASWDRNDPSFARAANRSRVTPDDRDNFVGFRCARTQ